MSWLLDIEIMSGLLLPKIVPWWTSLTLGLYLHPSLYIHLWQTWLIKICFEDFSENTEHLIFLCMLTACWDHRRHSVNVCWMKKWGQKRRKINFIMPSEENIKRICKVSQCHESTPYWERPFLCKCHTIPLNHCSLSWLLPNPIYTPGVCVMKHTAQFECP